LKKLFLALSALVIPMIISAPTNAQSFASQIVSVQGGSVIYRTKTQSFILCRGGMLQEANYKNLLKMNMANVVTNGLAPQMVATFDQQDQQTNGEMSKIMQGQKEALTQDQINSIYGPYKTRLGFEDFMKIQTLNAIGISQAMIQSIGNERIQQLCKTKN
jgi:hypothetical protein